MSSFRGVPSSNEVSLNNQGPNSPGIYNSPVVNHLHNQHSQASPTVQNDTLVGKALQTVSKFLFCFHDSRHNKAI